MTNGSEGLVEAASQAEGRGFKSHRPLQPIAASRKIPTFHQSKAPRGMTTCNWRRTWERSTGLTEEQLHPWPTRSRGHLGAGQGETVHRPRGRLEQSDPGIGGFRRTAEAGSCLSSPTVNPERVRV